MAPRPRLRVLSFTTLFPNRVEPLHGLFIKNRLERMAEYCDMTVIAPVNIVRRPAAIRRVERVESLGSFRVFRPYFGVIPGVCKHWDGALLFRQTATQLGRTLRHDDYDILDAHYAYPDGVAGYRLAKTLGKPFVISLRGSDIHVLTQFPRRRRLIQRVLQRADGIIAVSRALKHQAESLGADARKISVIANGVDTATFRPLDRDLARHRLGWAPATAVIVTVGRLSAVKGLRLLLPVAKSLRARVRRPLRWYVVGDGELRASLENEIHDLGLRDTVMLTGPMPPNQLPVWYSAADLCCLLSSSEGCPNVVLETLACGTPVVATDVGGIPDMIREGADGLLIRSRDVEDAASRLEQALAMTWDRQRITSNPAVRDWADVARDQVHVLEAIAVGS